MAIPQQALSMQEKTQRIVMAGMKVMYSPETSKMLTEGMTSDAPMPQKLAMEVAGVMKIVHDKTANGLPPETVAPAAMMLLFELAQFMQQSGAGSPTKDDISAAVPILQNALKSILQGQQKQPAPQQEQPPAQAPGLIAQQRMGA